MEHKILIEDMDTLQYVGELLGKAVEVSIDIESTGVESDDAFNPWLGKIAGVGFGWRTYEDYHHEIYSAYLPCIVEDGIYKERGGEVFPVKACLNFLCESVAKNATWIMHNAKFDLKWLELNSNYRWSADQLRDTMVEMWMYQVDEPRGLKDLIQKFYPERNPPVEFKDLVGRGKKKKKLEEVDVELVAGYCMDDCINTLLISDKLIDLLSAHDGGVSWDVYRTQEIKILRILTDMEIRGVQIDTKALEELARNLYAKKDSLETILSSYSDINWNSSKQLLPFLQGAGVKLPNVKTEKGAQKLDRSVLLSVEDQHPAISALLDIKEVNKLIGTYVEGFYREMDDEGKIHCDFRQTGTRTGRLSCSKPNLQNIPSDSFKKRESRLYEEYKTLRKLFVGEFHAPLIQADLSQIEMRFAAHFSEDPALVDIYKNGKDLHKYTSDRVTKGDRTLAKNVNFGFLYGQRARGLSNITDLSMEEAKVFIAQFEKTYRGLVLWSKREEARARQRGFVETILGRRRYLPNVKSADWYLASEATRQGINTIIQGSAADYLKKAMLMIDEEISSYGYEMVLQIHDELIFSPTRPVSEEETTDAAKFIKYCMENAMILKVPVEAEPKIVWSWAEAK